MISRLSKTGKHMASTGKAHAILDAKSTFSSLSSTTPSPWEGREELAGRGVPG